MPRLPSHRKNLCLNHLSDIFKNSSKIQFSHSKIEEKKIIPTIPIDMIGIKGYDKRNTKEAGQ